MDALSKYFAILAAGLHFMALLGTNTEILAGFAALCSAILSAMERSEELT